MSSIFDAYLWFRPYNPNRDSESVVIHNSQGTSFLHWDKGKRCFEREAVNGLRSQFPGREIDAKGVRSMAHADMSEGAVYQ